PNPAGGTRHRFAHRYERNDASCRLLDSVRPGFGLPLLSIDTDPELSAVFGRRLRYIIEERYIEPELVFKFQRLVAIPSMYPVARLWFRDQLQAAMKRRQSS